MRGRGYSGGKLEFNSGAGDSGCPVGGGSIFSSRAIGRGAGMGAGMDGKNRGFCRG